MNKLLIRIAALFSIIFSPSYIFSQDAGNSISTCTFYSSACSYDLSSPITGMTVLQIDDIPYAISASPAITKDVTYTNDPDCTGEPLSTICEDNALALHYTVYYPDKIGAKTVNYEDQCGLPAVIMFHGGSFWDCSSVDNDGISTICTNIAKRGFVVFNVEYRKGVMTDREKDPGGFFRFVSAQQVLGIYRACQDARGAVRSIIKSQRNPTDTDIHPGRYRIDTNKIFIGGMSAGSLMAMNTVYYQRHIQIDSSFPGVSTVLGDIDQDYYYGDTTINFLPNILGVLDMWGAIILHKNLSNQSSFFGGLQYHPPIIGFQGQGDIIFPPDRDFVYFSPPRSVSYDFLNRNLNTETHCLNTSSYSVDTFELNHDAIAIGIDRIWNIFKGRGWYAEIYLDCDMKHGLDDDGPGFSSDFGTGLTTRDSVFNYIAARTTTYFVAILTNKVDDLGLSRFVDCENKRIKCDTTNASTCGSGYDEETAGCD